ncbi:MAG: hypothetical protein ABFS86_04545, partial [Planctomycetota bacterium]
MNAGSEKAIARRVKQHVNGKEHRFFAVVQPGFEATARAELASIGVKGLGEPVEGGVRFQARLDDMIRANIASRVVTRVLMRIDAFDVDGFGRLARKAAAIPWELHLSDGAVVSFRVASAQSRLYHEGRIEEEFRSAVAARMAEYGRTVEFAAGGQAIHVRLRDDRCLVSLDTSGERLHRRGRRTFVGEASLRETIAAALLREAGWPGDYDTLVDPMCGAGTFSVEATEMARGTLPGADREFAFEAWPAFRPAAYSHLVAKMSAAAKVVDRRVLTSDVDPRAAKTARSNLGDQVVEVRDFLADPPAPEGDRRLYVLNPPYGRRLAGVDPRRVYRRIG